jgi:hypothetical protein
MINRSVLSRANRGAVKVKRKAKIKFREFMLDLSIFAGVGYTRDVRRRFDAASIRGDELPHSNRSTIGDLALPSRRS